MQKILPLSKAMDLNVEAKRDWVKGHYEDESISDYNSIEGKLVLLDVILKSGWIERDETVKLQSLGITLGDIIVQDMLFEWVEVRDQYGNDPAVRLPGTSIILFPLTMISKRIERGEVVDIYELYERLKAGVAEIRLQKNGK